MQDVDDYIAQASARAQPGLRAIRSGVQQALPAAVECFAYRMPGFRLQRSFFYYAAFKQHIGVYPPLRPGHPLAAEVQAFANARGNLAFALNQPLPVELIVRVAVALAAQYAEQGA